MQQTGTELDVRRLERGDAVELFVDGERRWRLATFDISTAGVAFVELPQRIQFRLEQALLMGLRAPRAQIGVDGARPHSPTRSRPSRGST